jgi:hypothetical protein
MKNPNAIVKKGKLTKEGNKPNRRVEHRLMIVKAKTLTWYHDQKELEQGKKPLGVIYMHAIYHCVPAKGLRSTDDFIVSFPKIILQDIDCSLCLEEEGHRKGG